MIWTGTAVILWLFPLRAELVNGYCVTVNCRCDGKLCYDSTRFYCWHFIRSFCSGFTWYVQSKQGCACAYMPTCSSQSIGDATRGQEDGGECQCIRWIHPIPRVWHKQFLRFLSISLFDHPTSLMRTWHGKSNVKRWGVRKPCTCAHGCLCVLVCACSCTSQNLFDLIEWHHNDPPTLVSFTAGDRDRDKKLYAMRSISEVACIFSLATRYSIGTLWKSLINNSGINHYLVVFIESLINHDVFCLLSYANRSKELGAYVCILI